MGKQQQQKKQRAPNDFFLMHYYITSVSYELRSTPIAVNYDTRRKRTQSWKGYSNADVVFISSFQVCFPPFPSFSMEGENRSAVPRKTNDISRKNRL